MDDLVADVESLKLKSKKCGQQLESSANFKDLIAMCGKAETELIKFLQENNSTDFIFQRIMNKTRENAIFDLEQKRSNSRILCSRTDKAIAILLKDKEAADDRIKNIKRKTRQVLEKTSDENKEGESVAGECEICFEKYDNKDHRHSAITACGHRFGSSCIKLVEYLYKIFMESVNFNQIKKTFEINAKCPKCNRLFTNDQILNLF